MASSSAVGVVQCRSSSTLARAVQAVSQISWDVFTVSCTTQ